MDDDEKEALRVVQWATGNIGTRSLRAVIEHPDLELVGLYVYSPDKVGVDAGELCGLGPTGVLATTDIDEVLALDADCVLYMPRATDIDQVCRLLESGADVVTTRGDFHHPGSMDPATRERVEAACRRRWHVGPQHREQPGIHLRGHPPGAELDPARARPPGHRGVRRPVATELAGTALRPHGLRRRAGHLR